MGPRPFGRGRSRESIGRGGAPTSLQWGRDLSVAEGVRITVIPNDADPLQWGRDLSVAEGTCSTGRARSRRPGFNGAATFRSRKVTPTTTTSVTSAALQWGRDLSVAEGSSPNDVGASTPELQWGRDLSVAEGDGEHRVELLRRSFNGAATFRSRKGRHRSLLCRRGPRFNGAATFRSRKGGGVRPMTEDDVPCFNGAATFRSRKGPPPRIA